MTRALRAACLVGVMTAACHPVVAAPRVCALPDNVVVTQTARLRLDGKPLTVAAMALPDPNDDVSRLLVLDQRCKPIWSATVDGAESRFDVRRLGRTELLQFVTLRVFGDGTGFVHRLLAPKGNGLAPLLPPIEHTAKDGFYLGMLSGGGEGIVTWSADPTGESEASAHPYVVTQWRWLGGRFGAPVSRETTAKYLPSDTQFPRADRVARDMKLPYRDQTGVNRFMDFASLKLQLNRLEP